MEANSLKKNRKSVMLQLSSIYFGLILLNILIFWFVTGANQVRLISEQASYLAETTANQILRRLDTMLLGSGQVRIADEATFFKTFSHTLREKPTEEKAILTNFQIVNSERKIIGSYPEKTAIEITPEVELNIYRALQMKQTKFKPYYAVPQLLAYKLTLYIPLIEAGDRHLVLMHDMHIASLRDEFFTLIRIGIGMILMLFFVQVFFGWILYRRFIRPVVEVGRTAVQLAAGEYGLVAIEPPGNNEIGSMVQSFNFMSTEIKQQSDTIKKAYADLKEKDHRSEYELEIAQRIQASIIPQAQDFGALKTGAIYVPLYSVSGDYYDILKLSDGSIAIFMADASGHGVPAAFLTMFAKVYFTSLVEKIKDPAELLQEINLRLSEFLEGNGLYLTAFYIRIYPDNSAELCNCMHPNPLVLSADGSFSDFESFGFFLGLMREAAMPFVTQKHKFAIGDKLILFTDGVTEAENNDKKMYGTDLLKDVISQNKEKPPAELAKAIYDSVLAHESGKGANDDLTILAIEFQQQVYSPQKGVESFQNKSYAEAETVFSALVAAGTEPVLRWKAYLAESLIKQEKHSEAVKLLEQLASEGQRTEQVLFKTGICYSKLNRYADAAKAFTATSEYAPSFAPAYARHAFACFQLGDYGQANSLIDKALEISPKVPQFTKLKEQIAALTR